MGMVSASLACVTGVALSTTILMRAKVRHPLDDMAEAGLFIADPAMAGPISHGRSPIYGGP
ncbi:hypothetical protein GCM10011505_28500 [Tistrella bauzanensis]|uniref:Uncharacterized protein n=1 Tax=Tistrella bauzanensis TaxID=657419 RepID=A0ABQ1ILF4_9PROT|nr:hypothetical protein [Tistrella bauzanensis]GGB45565.1 hypothetical protein GCM10011505_28500 [Tistrella bauzanensis]